MTGGKFIVFDAVNESIKRNACTAFTDYIRRAKVLSSPGVWNPSKYAMSVEIKRTENMVGLCLVQENYIKNYVLPNLEAGRPFVSEGGPLFTMAYLSSLGHSIDSIINCQEVVKVRVPDLTFYLRSSFDPKKEGLSEREKDDIKLIGEYDLLVGKAMTGNERLARLLGPVICIDGDQPPEVVSENILRAFGNFEFPSYVRQQEDKKVSVS